MQAARNFLKASALIKPVVQPQRSMSVVCTPPRNRISKVEFFGLGLAMVVGWAAIPVWVLVNLKHYKAK